MKASIRRRRLACVECTRRKIRCEKVIPCQNCIRRGIDCCRPQSIISTPQKSASLPLSERLINFQASSLSEHIPNRASEICSIQTPDLSPLRDLCEDTQDAAAAGSIDPPETDAEVEDAATILEFLAWGRRKVSTVHENSLNETNQSPHCDRTSDGDVVGQDESEGESPLSLTVDSPLSVLQLLLPRFSTLRLVVNYHCDCLLWYHTSFHGPSMQREVSGFLEKYEGHLDRCGVDLQWVALLFAVLAGSMTCAPLTTSQGWGFDKTERAVLSRRWFQAALLCLTRANFMACPSMYGVQCITTMTISAHMLGYSNSHSVMLAAAVRLAQALGLHRLGKAVDKDAQARIYRETGRRVWSELCIQDWFSIPFSETYLVRLLDFTTSKPSNCEDDDEMVPVPDTIPTPVSYHRFLYEVALLMPQLHDKLASCQTLYTRYKHVLLHDKYMRTLASTHVPGWLKGSIIEPNWPVYVPWARHCLAMSSAHKIIMIHRKFLWQSFTNPAFATTRKTCLAASKTILRTQKQVYNEGGPNLWIHHAFSVAAGIILCLDLRFHSPSDEDHNEHRKLVRNAVEILTRSEISMIAKRGVTILSMLLRLERTQNSQSISDTMPNARRVTNEIHELQRIFQAFFNQETSHEPADDQQPETPTSQWLWPDSGHHVMHRSQAENELPLQETDLIRKSVGIEEILESFLDPQSQLDIQDPLDDLFQLTH